MLGKWLCELCQDSDKIWEEAGVGAEWVEDAGRKCSVSWWGGGGGGAGAKGRGERWGLIVGVIGFYDCGDCHSCSLRFVPCYGCTLAEMIEKTIRWMSLSQNTSRAQHAVTASSSSARLGITKYRVVDSPLHP